MLDFKGIKGVRFGVVYHHIELSSAKHQLENAMLFIGGFDRLQQDDFLHQPTAHLFENTLGYLIFFKLRYGGEYGILHQ